MGLLRSGGRPRVAFDDLSLVSHSGLVSAIELAKPCDLQGVVVERVSVDRPLAVASRGMSRHAGGRMLAGTNAGHRCRGGTAAPINGAHATSLLWDFLHSRKLNWPTLAPWSWIKAEVTFGETTGESCCTS